MRRCLSTEIMSPTLNPPLQYIRRCGGAAAVIVIMRQLTLKNAHAYHDPDIPGVVFMIEKAEDAEGAEAAEGEKRAVAYLQRGDPTRALDLDCGRVLSLYRRGRRGVVAMNILSVAIHTRRADLILAIEEQDA